MPMLQYMLDAVIFLMVLVAGGLFIFKVKQSLDKAKDKLRQQEDDEARYADAMSRQFTGELTPDLQAPPVPFAPAMTAPPPRNAALNADIPAAAATDPLDATIRQLTQLRILDYREGELPLAVPPNGQIYRMTKGGSVLILPRVESQEVLSHLARRYDMIIVATGGEPLVIERLPSRLVSMVEMPGTGK